MTLVQETTYRFYCDHEHCTTVRHELRKNSSLFGGFKDFAPQGWFDGTINGFTKHFCPEHGKTQRALKQLDDLRKDIESGKAYEIELNCTPQDSSGKNIFMITYHTPY